MYVLYLNDNLKPYFNHDQSLFDQLMALDGEVFRNLEGRKTMRVKIGDKTYFIKQHRGVGYKEIFKNLSQLRMPVISAKNEWRAIKELQALGIHAPKVVAYGERGQNPAKIESFVLMEEVAPAISLEDLAKQWQQQQPEPAFKRALIEKVATYTRVMHEAGINHRDLYICHFLMIISDVKPSADNLNLYLIDLHRAQQRKHPVARWVIKDLAGLYFSSKDAGLTKRDLYRFMQTYSQKPLREIMQDATQMQLWERVTQRGEQLYHDHAH